MLGRRLRRPLRRTLGRVPPLERLAERVYRALERVADRIHAVYLRFHR